MTGVAKVEQEIYLKVPCDSLSHPIKKAHCCSCVRNSFKRIRGLGADGLGFRV